MGATDPKEVSNITRVRLHITPFDQTLLDRFVPAAVRPLASNVSFHAVQTFPEKGFGYVELPAMEATKLRNKLNGTTLRGTKVHIEEAKPEKKRKADEAEEERSARKRAKREKRQREEGVLVGHELAEGRHVKRGWEESGRTRKKEKDGKKDKREKSRVSKDAPVGKDKKMLFKTSLPPNSETEDRKEKTKSKEKVSKKKKPVIVKEFENTRKHLHGDAVVAGGGTKAFQDGFGWVDETGRVIEAEPKSLKRKHKLDETTHRPIDPPRDTPEAMDDGTAHEDDNEASAGDSSGQDTDGDNKDHTESTGLQESPALQELRATAPQPAAEEVTAVPEVPPPPSPKEAEAAKVVHPLEALFKRPPPQTASPNRPKPQPIDTTFSFFNSTAAQDDGEDDSTPSNAFAHPPQTPHTTQDLEWRRIRSAAPTPDTAFFGHRSGFPVLDHDEDDMFNDEEVDLTEVAQPEVNTMASVGAAPATAPQDGAAEEESEFRKWFYDNRGDLNRSWKKRRREERKSKRQLENRRLSRRVV